MSRGGFQVGEQTMPAVWGAQGHPKDQGTFARVSGYCEQVGAPRTAPPPTHSAPAPVLGGATVLHIDFRAYHRCWF